MTHLSLSTLGPFEVTLDGEPVTGFKSTRVRALLAYLAVEADRPHSRDVLAGLLWPDWPDREALNNLRYALSDLRRAIGDRDADPPFLLITRETLQFTSAADASVDLATFGDLTTPAPGPEDLAGLERAVALYRGDFLEGLSLGDSPAFDEWVLLTRERLARQMASVLTRLAASYEQSGDYQQAQRWAWRQLELEPWDEAAHRQLMRALAFGGQRSAALAQYETCRRALAAELGVEPAKETHRLYEQIRDGEIETPGSPPARVVRPLSPAAFLSAERDGHERPPFVARERELGRLDHFLDLALSGRGRVAFVTGEAGSGKTALIDEFTRRAQEKSADLIVAGGNCNAHFGVGDPYLPWREILALLTGDVEARWAAGAISGERARRLWHTAPLAMQALVEAGPHLVDTFVPGPALIGRATAYASGEAAWLTHLDGLVRSGAARPPFPGVLQSDLFQQYAGVLKALARASPLLLVVDDLQWADAGAIGLLFYLGRQLGGSRILMVGAYRPEEVAIGRHDPATAPGQTLRHPLEPAVNELQRLFGDILVSVDQAERQDFVDALLDSEPNRLGPPFRETLHRRTLGHPLFTVELLRGMQDRGDLIRDPDGRWIEGPALDWETLPARVEAAIAERIGRLDQPLREALRVASVEGEEFTAEVVARVLRVDERDLVLQFSQEIDRRHRLIRARAIEQLGSQRVSRYRFRHILTQEFLYESLDPVERAYLHEDVGTALEGLCGDQGSELAVQLARHFQKAGIGEKAIGYLHQAGERAAQLSAYEEAIAHLNRALALLMSLPDTPERAQDELGLQLSLAVAIVNSDKPEREQALLRARHLCRQVGDSSQLCRVTGELAVYYFVQADHQRALRLAQEALELAETLGDPLLVTLGHWYIGFISFVLGEFTTAQAHLDEVIAFYDPQQHHRPLVLMRGGDAGLSALAYRACYLWCLGYPDAARRQSQDALTLARALNHPFSLADVLCYAGCIFHRLLGDAAAVKAYADELIELSGQHPLLGWYVEAIWERGWAAVAMGAVQEGIAQIDEGLQAMLQRGTRLDLAETLSTLAYAEAESGRPAEGLRTLERALEMVEQTGERYYQAEMHRLQAELSLMLGDEAGAEASLQAAIETARRQGAKSFELRAVAALSRLWARQGRCDQARRQLADIYGWFTEGFDTPDLREAKRLLEELSRGL